MRLLVSLNWFFVGGLTSEDGTEMLYRNVGNKTNILRHTTSQKSENLILMILEVEAIRW